MKSNKTEETYLKLYLGTLQQSALSCKSKKKNRKQKNALAEHIIYIYHLGKEKSMSDSCHQYSIYKRINLFILHKNWEYTKKFNNLSFTNFAINICLPLIFIFKDISWKNLSVSTR